MRNSSIVLIFYFPLFAFGETMSSADMAGNDSSDPSEEVVAATAEEESSSDCAADLAKVTISTSTKMEICERCKEELGSGKSYVTEKEKPYCVPCYEEEFCEECKKCSKKIRVGTKSLLFKGSSYHDECFVCSGCETRLSSKQIMAKDDGIFCLKCQNIEEKNGCEGCGKDFVKGDKRSVAGNKFYHDYCFKCSECENPMGNASFFILEEKKICQKCYQEKYVKKCPSCEKDVAGGIVYNGKNFHPDCFVCKNCDKCLSGVKFSSRENQIYCMDCLAELFLEKCKICEKHIKGGKMMKYDDKSYHSECFNCNTCNNSLVGQGFFIKEGALCCKECTTQ